MDKKIETLLITHAKIEPEKECCGFIVLDNLKQLIIIPCENIYDYPKEGFKICPYKFLEVKKKYDIVCLYHSHPVGDAIFSQKDIDQSEELCIPICLYALETDNFNIFFPTLQVLVVNWLERNPYPTRQTQCAHPAKWT